MADLGGRRIVVLEARMPSELANLVTRHGGEAISAPALREAPLPMRQDVQDVIAGICTGDIGIAVFLTGVGARALINAADELGRKDEFLDALRRTIVICRGPKPVAVLKPLNVPIALVAPTPYTSEDVVTALKASDIDVNGKRVLLQHYGEVNAWLRGELVALGADVLEVSLYSWQLPEDTRPVVDAIGLMLAQDVDALMLTTQSQAHNLFRIAEQVGLADELREALSSGVVVASVGPVCTRALRDHGVEPHVEPVNPKMGPLVLALADYFANDNEPQQASVAAAAGP